ncbi:DNA internalization-related competence protein ComEC/Rec2 [Vibrio sp. DW001]|uniref:DNA internalization-related competence protein ComEC/Rec2 n=1 Tax=Vibrio sp. DW001 TaxID=2912315 RepID=UPI0023AFC861|nr:DNA internalization-related competence protein ComEC/Rec2 [Vibrio sp. DW001]WED27848.1 DNA internalization-related competence protein ComEC/Rec2 [Vibrio sp. DW001]
MTLYCYYWNIIVFIATTLTFPYWPYPLAIKSVVAFLIIIIVSYQMPAFGWARGFLLALSLISLHSHLFQVKVESVFRFGNDTTITARVDSFFKQITRGNEYLLRLESVNGEKMPYFFQPNIKLIAPKEVELNLGERWELAVEVKPVIGRLNEAGFDQEKYYISQGWHAKAKLTDIRSAKIIEQSNSLRLRFYRIVIRHIEALPNKAMLLALSFGDRNHISAEQWQQLKASGLIHLVAISGLHIGIAYFIGWRAGSLVRLIFRHWYSAPLIIALLFSATYSWLAGFSIPTIRALIMCCMLGAFSYRRLHFSSWQILIFAMAGLLAFDPFSVLSVSFGLTFFAVACIYIVVSIKFFSQSGWFRTLIFMPLALSAVMVPVTSYYFAGFSLSSSVYNFFFVPLFSFAIVPLLFVALLASITIPTVAPYVWKVVDRLLDVVNWSIPFAMDSWIHVDRMALASLTALMVFICVRPLMRREHQITVFITIFFVIQSMTFKSKAMWEVSVLDVGHGLAVLIEKDSRYFLYDTGAKWETGSIAEMIIAPVLRRRGVTRLDLLTISHFDSDHAGGREYIEQQFSPKQKLSSQHIDGYLPCIDKTEMEWNGLTLSVVWPPKIVKRAYNPHSCVIKVTDGASSVLLTGDIEAVGELLLAQQKERIRSDILLVPHHGSKTSSTNYFLDAVGAKVGLASVAKGNQWGLPDNKVVSRYTDRGAIWLDTGESGQISIVFSHEGWKIMTKRSRQSLTWYRQILRKGVE